MANIPGIGISLKGIIDVPKRKNLLSSKKNFEIFLLKTLEIANTGAQHNLR